MDDFDDSTSDETIPIPMQAIATLMRHVDFPEEDKAKPNGKTVREAHDEVYTWLIRLQVEHGYTMPQDDEQWATSHPNLVVLGGCPKCNRNDGYVVIGDNEVWALCHEHEYRWAVDYGVLIDMVVPYGDDLWNAPDRPLRKYSVVKPVNLLARQKIVRLPKPIPQFPKLELPIPQEDARLRLVYDADTDPERLWPPPGGPTLREWALRIVGLAYLLYVITPREFVYDVIERVEGFVDWHLHLKPDRATVVSPPDA
jgi:hypothetical protein